MVCISTVLYLHPILLSAMYSNVIPTDSNKALVIR